MKNISSQELQERINIKLDEIRLLFENKNEQYATDDALANFTMGGRLLCGDEAIKGKYEALKAYVSKHIAHIYNNDISGRKVDESVMDIVVYFLLASVMVDMSKEKTNELI